MNVPGIRAALERMTSIHECDGDHAYQPSAIRCEVIQAVVRVGLRACDEWEKRPHTLDRMVWTARVAVIADILREAGVEVEGEVHLSNFDVSTCPNCRVPTLCAWHAGVERLATPGKPESEIDEAAAEKHCRWIIANPGAFAGKDYAAHNAARAALAWKARAEAAEAERDELRQAVKSLTKLADLAEVSR